jgi:hypothetical protein
MGPAVESVIPSKEFLRCIRAAQEWRTEDGGLHRDLTMLTFRAHPNIWAAVLSWRSDEATAREKSPPR